jgi:gamma-glutamyltranspeptidase/glutathione hydrolase
MPHHAGGAAPAPAPPEQGPKPPARAARAMVATSHPAVTAAALAVLRAGGNAIDALLTAIPLQQVLEPQLSTIAGGFALLYWDAARGEPVYLNAHPDHPRGGAPPPPDGADTSGARIAVPGTVAGLQVAAAR